MTAIDNLVSAKNNKKAGNHKVEFVFGGNARNFIYYWTTICGVDDVAKTFYIDSSYGTQSTTRTCNAYRREFLSRGYKEVSKVTGQAV
jgi:hypothetical protein